MGKGTMVFALIGGLMWRSALGAPLTGKRAVT